MCGGKAWLSWIRPICLWKREGQDSALLCSWLLSNVTSKEVPYLLYVYGCHGGFMWLGQGSGICQCFSYSFGYSLAFVFIWDEHWKVYEITRV